MIPAELQAAYNEWLLLFGYKWTKVFPDIRKARPKLYTDVSGAEFYQLVAADDPLYTTQYKLKTLEEYHELHNMR